MNKTRKQGGQGDKDNDKETRRQGDKEDDKETKGQADTVTGDEVAAHRRRGHRCSLCGGHT